MKKVFAFAAVAALVFASCTGAAGTSTVDSDSIAAAEAVEAVAETADSLAEAVDSLAEAVDSIQEVAAEAAEAVAE